MSEVIDPVFVVGCPRSGTTLLATILGRHSKLASAPETYFVSQIAAALNDPRTQIEDLSRLRGIADLEISTSAVKEMMETRSPQKAYAIMAREFTRAQNKDAFIEKTPEHLIYWRQILSFFPNAKFVVLVRDGRDVVLSLNKAQFSSNIPVRHGAQKWNQYARAHQSLIAGAAERTLQIKYEDLVRDSETVIRALCLFIGIEFEETMLDSRLGSSAIPESEQGWKKQASGSISSKSVGRFKTELSSEEAQILTLLMSRRLKLYGYSTRPSMPLYSWSFVRTWLYSIAFQLANQPPILRIRKLMPSISGSLRSP